VGSEMCIRDRNRLRDRTFIGSLLLDIDSNARP
jgi:hypothetical protein